MQDARLVALQNFLRGAGKAAGGEEEAAGERGKGGVGEGAAASVAGGPTGVAAARQGPPARQVRGQKKDLAKFLGIELGTGLEGLQQQIASQVGSSRSSGEARTIFTGKSFNGGFDRVPAIQ